MKDDLDKYVKERWGSWDNLYASASIEELLEEVLNLTNEIEKHRHDFDDGYNSAVSHLQWAGRLKD